MEYGVCKMGIGAAIIGGALISGVASNTAANTQSHAAEDAGRIVERADERARMDLQPFRDLGGSAIDPGSRNKMAARGVVVYLHASVEQQLERTRKGRERPLLRGKDPREVLEELMAIRDPQYREIADITIETDGRHVSSVVREIEKKLAELPGA